MNPSGYLPARPRFAGCRTLSIARGGGASTFVLGLVASAILISIGAAPVRSQELYLGWGAMYTPTIKETTARVFEYGYRYDFNPKVALSVAWLNEGHVTGHHRDGIMGEIWRSIPLDRNHWALSLGIGPYYYFDTQGHTPYDVHGTAVVSSVMLTYYVDQTWFYRVTGNAVTPRGNIQTMNVDIGFGRWLDPKKHPLWSEESPHQDGRIDGRSELTGLFGGSVENAFNGQHRLAYALEYRYRTQWSWKRAGVTGQDIDLTVSYINEHDLRITRRQGVAGQIWPANEFSIGNGTLRVAVGVGVYSAIGPRNDIPKGQYFTPIVAPFFTFPMISYQFHNGLVLRFQFNRVTGYHDPDADVILLGAGWKF